MNGNTHLSALDSPLVAIAIVITKMTGEVEAFGCFSSHWGAPV